MRKRPFIIDCDTGTDDAIAIVAALASDELDVLAVTSVNGNVQHRYTSANNLNLLEYLGVSGVEVAKGASVPFYPRGNYYGSTHGAEGLGTIKLPLASHLTFSKDLAHEVIHREAVSRGGELELLVLGPMTNIAIALSLYPEICDQIKHIWFMGGAVIGGNVNTTAEFNIWVDPYAARMVLNSGIPMTMVGLDVTEKAILNQQDADFLRKAGTKGSVLTADILEYMLGRCAGGGEDAVMHDALALAAALCPDCMSYKRYYVDVECEGRYTAGHTMVDVRGKIGKEPNVSVALELKLPAFKTWLLGLIAHSLGA